MARRRKDPDYVSPGLNGQLLRLRAWCRLHGKTYSANLMIRGRLEGQGCPLCADDRGWAVKANKQMVEAGTPVTEETLVAKAEDLAGHRLYRYHPHG